MEWLEKLRELVQDPSKRGRIKPILLEKSKEYRDAIFGDDDKAVEASLLSLIEPTPGTTGVLWTFPRSSVIFVLAVVAPALADILVNKFFATGTLSSTLWLKFL